MLLHTDLLCNHGDGLLQGLVEDTLLAAVGVRIHSRAQATVEGAVRCGDTSAR